MRGDVRIPVTQRGLPCEDGRERANVLPLTRKAPLMRLSVDSLRRVVKRDLALQFVPQQLTSYGGLELLRRYGRRLALPARLRTALAGLGGDYGGAPLARLVLALIY